MFSVHNACAFGAVASVHAWERLGAALCYLGRKLLGLPLLRYVDDYYGPDRYVMWSTPCDISRKHALCRLETLSHGVTCLVRLVRILLGHLIGHILLRVSFIELLIGILSQLIFCVIECKAFIIVSCLGNFLL